MTTGAFSQNVGKLFSELKFLSHHLYAQEECMCTLYCQVTRWKFLMYITCSTVFCYACGWVLIVITPCAHRCLESCVGPGQDLATPHFMRNCGKRILSLHCGSSRPVFVIWVRMIQNNPGNARVFPDLQAPMHVHAWWGLSICQFVCQLKNFYIWYNQNWQQLWHCKKK